MTIVVCIGAHPPLDPVSNRTGTVGTYFAWTEDFHGQGAYESKVILQATLKVFS